MNEMHEYQQRAVERVVGQKKIALWLEMGLGKTRICIEAMKRLSRPRALVICPKSVVWTWENEFRKWDNGARVSLVVGNIKKRNAALDVDADVYVVSRDNVKWLLNTKRKRFSMLVVDESTSFKNISTQRFKALKKMLRQFDRVVLLSGVPNANGYQDLFGQYYLIDTTIFGKSITAFREKYFHGFMLNGIKIYTTPRKGAVDDMNERIKNYTFALTAKDWLTLPDKIIHNVDVVMDDNERKQYETMKRNYILGNDVTSANVAVLYQKLSQMANGFVYNDRGEIFETGDSKWNAFKEMLETVSDNVIVFYKYIHDKNLLLEHGGRLLQDEKDFDEWNAGKIKFAVASPETVGRGVNLQDGGHIVVWYSLPWSYELYVQANARLYRQGQKFPVTIIHMLTRDTIDELILDALKNKKTDVETLIRSVKTISKRR